MKPICCLGAYYFDEIILPTDSPFAYHQPCLNYSQPSGDMYNIAYNLALNKHPGIFFSKFGSDTNSFTGYEALTKLNVSVFGPTINARTLKRSYIPSLTDKVFEESNKSFNFTNKDLAPCVAIDTCEYTITDSTNDKWIKSTMSKTSKTKWILSNHLVDNSILPQVEGIILSQQQALQYAKAQEFDRLGYRVTANGVKWLIIHLDNDGIFLYQNREAFRFKSLRGDNGFSLGTYPAFITGLLLGLVKTQDLKQAITLGIYADATNYKSYKLNSTIK